MSVIFLPLKLSQVAIVAPLKKPYHSIALASGNPLTLKNLGGSEHKLGVAFFLPNICCKLHTLLPLPGAKALGFLVDESKLVRRIRRPISARPSRRLLPD